MPQAMQKVHTEAQGAAFAGSISSQHVKFHFFSTQIEMNLLIVESNDERMDIDGIDIDLEARERSMNMPICIDAVYNLIVCKDCSIGLPFEWVLSHLNDHHGIRATEDQVLDSLNIDGDAMTVAEAKDWIQSTWIGRAVQNIPVIIGLRCNECQYSAATKKAIKNHFSAEHKELKREEHIEECKVQLVFKGRFHKYIQVREYDEMDIDFGGNPDWKEAVTMDFTKSMANVKISGTSGHGNLRLMNVFIAKTRWDVVMEGKDLKEVVMLAGAPPSNQDLHKIILCGRRYIYRTCEALDKGSVVVKRLLMSGGYLTI
jgi:Orsellinic acid/F9775 biosynthesis cluster protein D